MSRSSQKREDILQAAITEFKNRGFENTSMDQIAVSAQVSKRTVYNHFASKELLFDGILDKMLTLVITAVTVNYDAEGPLDIQLKDFARQEIDLLGSEEFNDLAKVCLSQAIHNPERINEALEKIENREGDLNSWVSAAHADGRIQVPDVHFATTQFFALIKSFCFWPQLIHGQPYPDSDTQQLIVESTVSMFLKQYQI